mmetsp:Transcript_101170/g.325067  ORF Transcript_101170/g.325067 Transcript_101170/m.325067 type:complete len:265 (-) Transcript_101170:1560-2354(-)
MDGISKRLHTTPETLAGKKPKCSTKTLCAAEVVQRLRVQGVHSKRVPEVLHGRHGVLGEPQGEREVVPDLFLGHRQRTEVSRHRAGEVVHRLLVSALVDQDLPGVKEGQRVPICRVDCDAALICRQGLLITLRLKVDVGVVELHAAGAKLLEAVGNGDGLRARPIDDPVCAEHRASEAAEHEQGCRQMPRESATPAKAAVELPEMTQAHETEQQPGRGNVQQALSDHGAHRKDHVGHREEAQNQHRQPNDRGLSDPAPRQPLCR